MFAGKTAAPTGKAALASEVARNAVFVEQCRKEEFMLNNSKPPPFRFEPRTAHPLPSKPNHHDPHDQNMDINNDGHTTEQEARYFDAALKKLAVADIDPTERMHYSTSESQSYGWMLRSPRNRDRAERLQRSGRNCHKPKSHCDITRYADNFANTFGESPFKAKGGARK